MFVEVEGTPWNLHPIVRDEIYGVASEALRNAFRHAQRNRSKWNSAMMSDSFDCGSRRWQGHRRDVPDGRGACGALRPSWHARARQVMGGKLTVWTAAGSGTEIELIIPAAHAYAAAPRRSWLLRSFSGKSARSKS